MKKLLVITLIFANTTSSLFTQEKNRIPEMSDMAQSLRAGEPSPLWQTPLKELEIDELLTVPNAGVLVGLTSIYWDEWLWGSYIPSYGPYIMYDSNTGQEKWSYSRDKSYNNSYQVLAYDPVILIRFDTEKKTKYIALDPQTGNEVWSYAASLKNRVYFNLSGSNLFIEEQKNSTIKLTSINLKDGNQIWQSLEERFPANDPLPEMNMNSENLFLAGNALAAYSVVNGKVSWFIDKIGLNSDKNFFALLPGGDLVVPSANGSLSRVDHQGKFVWQTKFENQPGILLSDSSKLYLQITDAGKQDRFFCYSLADGHLLWSNELKGKITSHFLLAEGKIVYTYKNSNSENLLEILDAQTGKLIRDQFLAIQPELSLTDRLIAYPGQVNVIWERGVGAFRLTDGTRLWLYNINDPEGIYENLVNDWGKAYQAYLTDNTKDKGKSMTNFGNIFQNYSSHSLIAWSENQQAEVFRRTNPIISATSKATHTDKQFALSEQKMAIDFNITSLELQRSFDLMSNNINMVMSGIKMGYQALEKRKQAISVSRAQHWFWGLRTINRIQQNNVQGDYYVHAFAGTDTSFAVMLVNLKNGYWQEIRTSPYCKDYFDETMNYRLPALSIDGKRLFVRGIGLDPSKWKQAKAKDRILLSGGLYNNAYVLPAPSLLAYDIKDNDFVDSVKYTMSHLYGYSNANGKMVIQPQYDWAGPFENGAAKVQAGGKYGLIDKSGKFLAKPIYDEIGYFSEEVAMVKIKDKLGYINNKGEIIVPLQFESAFEFSEGKAIVKLNGKFGLLNLKGHYILEPQFEYLEQPVPNMKGILYKLNGKMGCILDSGRNIKPQFDILWAFSKDGLAKAKTNYKDKWGFIDFTGKFAISPQFDDVEDFENGFCNVENNGKWGAIDKTGKITVPLKYDSYFYINEGIATFKHKNLFGFIDLFSGKEIINPNYENADACYAGLIAVEKKDKWGYIDKTGSVVIPFQFDYANHFSKDGYASVNLNNKFGLIDKTGKFVIDAKYDDIFLDMYNADQPYFRNGYIEAKQGKKSLYFDKNGNIVNMSGKVSDANNKNQNANLSNVDLFPVCLGKRYWIK